jgi:hypothetical protein
MVLFRKLKRFSTVTDKYASHGLAFPVLLVSQPDQVI